MEQGEAEVLHLLGEQLARWRKAAAMSQHDLAPLLAYGRSTVANVETGRQRAPRSFWERADEVLQAGGLLLDAYVEASDRLRARVQAQAMTLVASELSADDELAAVELRRRVAASDVSNHVLTTLEGVVDELAIAYPRTPPEALAGPLRAHLGYVGHLLGASMTLPQRRRLVVLGGWLSLLSATVNIDLKRTEPALAQLRTADDFAAHAGHDEIRAWVRETEAWRLLTNGQYKRALDLSVSAQCFAPGGSSIEIQAQAQAGRAYARLGQARETYAALDRVTQLAAPLRRPDHPEHHYRYDPTKAQAYLATTLAWVGDPIAETYAREVISQLAPDVQHGRWPRRLASANLDLALALLVSDRLDEACAAAQLAVASGRVVPSNRWRAAEVVRAVEARQVPEAQELREVYEATRPA